MAKSYADDLRRKLLQAYDRGEGTLGGNSPSAFR
jgi:hypothetical protein